MTIVRATVVLACFTSVAPAAEFKRGCADDPSKTSVATYPAPTKPLVLPILNWKVRWFSNANEARALIGGDNVKAVQSGRLPIARRTVVTDQGEGRVQMLFQCVSCLAGLPESCPPMLYWIIVEWKSMTASQEDDLRSTLKRAEKELQRAGTTYFVQRKDGTVQLSYQPEMSRFVYFPPNVKRVIDQKKQ